MPSIIFSRNYYLKLVRAQIGYLVLIRVLVAAGVAPCDGGHLDPPYLRREQLKRRLRNGVERAGDFRSPTSISKFAIDHK
jgi:hypothetical protein